MKKSLKNVVLFGVMAFSILVASIPIIFFAALGAWPVELPIAIIYYVSLGISLCVGIVWPLLLLKCKGSDETSIIYLQLLLTMSVQFLPIVTWLFSLVPGEAKQWIFIFPLIIDLFGYLAYALILALTTRLAHKAVATLEQIKAEEAPVVNAEQTFNNEDGTFKGSRVKVNNNKKD